MRAPPPGAGISLTSPGLFHVVAVRSALRSASRLRRSATLAGSIFSESSAVALVRFAIDSRAVPLFEHTVPCSMSRAAAAAQFAVDDEAFCVRARSQAQAAWDKRGQLVAASKASLTSFLL